MEHVVAGDPEPGRGPELLEREIRELRSALDSANAEVEETHADAVRLQGERDDALRDADDVRSQILSEVAAARDDEIRVQDRLDEALRMVDDGRGQASEEQWRLIEELDALHEELAVCRQELAEARQTGRRPGGG
jgi:phage shock protein A